MSENKKTQETSAVGSSLSDRLGRLMMQDFIFTAWYDRPTDGWRAKAENPYLKNPFAYGAGDSANEATEDCVVNTSIRLNQARAT